MDFIATGNDATCKICQRDVHHKGKNTWTQWYVMRAAKPEGKPRYCGLHFNMVKDRLMKRFLRRLKA